MDPAAVANTDQVRRFLFEKRPVRGHWIRLGGAWQQLRAHTRYPARVGELLGEAVAASVLLAATLKFRGTLTFQLQGNGLVGLLVAQCTHDFRVRAMARWDAAGLTRLSADDGNGALFRGLVGAEGRVTVTVEADERSSRYQSVVPLDGASLAQSLETYFASSEQLPTRVLLAADERFGAGILVQKLPGADAGETGEGAAAAWEAARSGIERLRGADLLASPVEPLLSRGFGAHDLRLFRGAAVRFECRCSQGRVAGLLRALGADEVRAVLREQGAVTVTCEFCQRPYRFDAVDVETLFTGGWASGSFAVH